MSRVFADRIHRRARNARWALAAAAVAVGLMSGVTRTGRQLADAGSISAVRPISYVGLQASPARKDAARSAAAEAPARCSLAGLELTAPRKRPVPVTEVPDTSAAGCQGSRRDARAAEAP